MNGCAVSILYFCVILPGTMVADVFLGGNGIFSVLGIVVAFILYATRTPSPESPPAPPASDDLISLRQLVFDLQQQVQALRRELRQLQAKVANQPRIPITLPLRLEESPQKLPRPTIGNCPMLLPRQNPPNPHRRPSSKPNPAPSPFLPTTTLSSPDANRHRVRVPHRRHPPPQMMQTIARLRRSPPSSAKTYC